MCLALVLVWARVLVLVLVQVQAMVSKRGGRQAVPFLGGEMAMRGVESRAPFGARLKLRVTQEKHFDADRKWVSEGRS